jgi:hypothetical protein
LRGAAPLREDSRSLSLAGFARRTSDGRVALPPKRWPTQKETACNDHANGRDRGTMRALIAWSKMPRRSTSVSLLPPL